MVKADLLSMTLPELKEFMVTLDEKPYRSAQLFEWMHKKTAAVFDEMTDLPMTLRTKLAQCASVSTVRQADRIASEDDGVIKYLFEIENGLFIESVLMKYDYGNSVCVSSQAGCRMKCTFCASAYAPFDRNLTAGEMLEQVYQIQKDIGERVSHIVVMGIGEPFDNYDNVMKFLRLLNDEKGLNISQRNITVSTSGITNCVMKFADEATAFNLAVSLHAPNDFIRKQIMPIANKYPFADLLKACDYYTKKTKRRITFEYAMTAGLNDNESCAAELKKSLKGMLCHVNLIPLNTIQNKDYKTSDSAVYLKFQEILKSGGIETTIRRRRGADIGAACGQLRAKQINC